MFASLLDAARVSRKRRVEPLAFDVLFDDPFLIVDGNAMLVGVGDANTDLCRGTHGLTRGGTFRLLHHRLHVSIYHVVFTMRTLIRSLMTVLPVVISPVSR